ncbi:MAG: cytochrome c oxidase subunit II [Acidimicrobiaceae bacterium]|nr:cytochrome c oxidase subunit II [Acidimicrobiaceae bacterium]
MRRAADVRLPARPLGRVSGWLLSLLGAAVATGCASDAELDTFAPQGPIARELHSRGVLPVFWIAAVVLVGITVAMVWLIWRNRVKNYEGDDEWPAQTHGHVPLEVGWTVGFFVTMAAVAGIMLWSLPTVDATETNLMGVTVDDRSVEWEPTVVVVGNQWWWEFRYYFSDQVDLADLRAHGDAKTLPPADIVTSGQMVIPTGEEVELILTSRDVIHSFWIPALNGKRDAVPNRFSPWKIEASDPGFYFGQCTEFCGLSHSRMRMQVVALTPADFQSWVDDTTQDAVEPADPAALAGLEVFSGICTSCHVIEGVNDDVFESADQASGAAPNLTHLASRSTFAGGIFNLYNADGSLNRVQLEAWLRNPGDLKANYTVPGKQYRGMPDLDLSEQQIDDLVAYLAGLGNRPADWIIEATQVE